MSHDVGVWIDHKKAVIVSIAAGHVSTKTLESDVGPHPHFSGSQEFYDDVVRQLGEPDALLLFGPGEAKLQLKERLGRSRLGRSNPLSESIVTIESTDKLTDPQIVAKVKEHYGIAR